MIDSREDWFELIAHTVGGLLVVLFCWWFWGQPLIGAATNLFIWPPREVLQRIWKNQHWTEAFTRLQPFAEGFLPVLAGFILAGVLRQWA